LQKYLNDIRNLYKDSRQILYSSTSVGENA